MRKNNLFIFVLILAVVIGTSGCATTMTMMSPVSSKVVVKSKRTGAFERYAYDYRIKDASIILTKTPLCNEVAEAVRVSQKREIGYGPAMLEMAFFGMGLLDIASASAVSDASRRVYPLAEYNTGKLLTCGKSEPAAGEVLLIESREKSLSKTGITDENGRIDLEAVIGRVRQPLNLKIRLAADASVSFTCMYRSTSTGNDLLSWAR